MPKVKIKDQDRRVGLSIGVVVAAAVVLWFTWLLWSSGPRYTVAQRRLDQVRLVYSCDAGHLFEAPGGIESRPCLDPACGQRAWPVWTFQCSKHGAFVLQLRYALQGGRPRIIKARLIAQEWRDVAADHRLGAVVDDRGRDPAEVGERAAVAVEERAQVLAGGEAAERVARVGQRPVERVDLRDAMTEQDLARRIAEWTAVLADRAEGLVRPVPSPEGQQQ